MKVTELDPMDTTASVRWSGEKPQSVHQQLPAVQGAEIAGRRIAEADHAQQRVVRGIRDRDGVGKLFGRIHPVAVGDRNFRRRDRARDLARECGCPRPMAQRSTAPALICGHPATARRITAISCV